MHQESSFAGKFLKRLKKIDSEQVEAFLGQVIREKTFLEGILDSITEGVLVTEGGSKVVFLNGAARQLLGLGRGELVGRPLESVLKNPTMVEIARDFRETLKPVRNLEVLIANHHDSRGANEPIFLSITIQPIENEDALTTHAVWILSDRTEVHRMAEEKQQIGNMESLATLTAGVAHEVKNPLNSLNIHAQIMSRTLQQLEDQVQTNTTGQPPITDIQRLRQSTGVILEEIDRLAHIVDDFIKAVRPIRPNLRREDINRILSNLGELVGPECEEKGIKFVLDLDPEVPPLSFDPEQILQALLNILKNAMEALDKSDGRITLRSTLKSDHVLLEVADNGCGIPEKDRLKIFEPYYTTKFTGTGLGLMVVYRIIRAHRAAIGLKSEVGKGTIFSIAFPLNERPVRLLAAQVEPEITALPLEEKSVISQVEVAPSTTRKARKKR